jgi:hypothetical protein
MTDTDLFLNCDSTLVGHGFAENKREESRLPGPVRPDQGDAIAAIYLEGYVSKKDTPGKRF